MLELMAWVSVALGLVAVLLLVMLWRRQPPAQVPPEFSARLILLEQQLQFLGQSSTRVEASLARLEDLQRELSVLTDQRLDASRQSLEAKLDASRQTLDVQLDKTIEAARLGRAELVEGFEKFATRVEQRFGVLQDTVSQQLRHLSADAQQNAEQVRSALNERLAALQTENASKLEEMRRTVDEKLHATLEQRLGESFRLVSERLEQVHAGLGEMKTLAGSVGDLKRVMTNVRARGTWGEVQLGAIIESLLTAEQFERNVKTIAGSNEMVEFAIKMPGQGLTDSVWLPIDSKYPVEHYQRLQEAYESADKDLILKTSAAFESSVRLEAKKIREKYVSPPQTTDFAILFVPTEGLFAEICRVPGMVEALQNDFRVVVAGPTTLAAMLNSLRLGFRTLAIEKRSSEVWTILSGVKSEFRKFGEIVDATHKSIDSAAKKFSEIGVRTRAIERRLRGVEELPLSADSPPSASVGLGSANPADDLPPDGDDRMGH